MSRLQCECVNKSTIEKKKKQNRVMYIMSLMYMPAAL